MEVAGNPIRVQSLVQDAKAALVPPQYVQPPETRPQLSLRMGSDCNETTPPIVDLSNSNAVEQVGRACREWGAFHVINHGVSVELLDEMRRVGRLFFEDCTMEQKLSYSCDPNTPASEGYGSRMLVASNDTVLDWRDYFDHHTLPLSRRNSSRWPHFSPNYR